ncbi:unnamed protein product [Amoebophrya sp. A120]|nr:unnamed protein product [Amoebophrya sp. A120]|eukprot:GSA120T00001219001.1
MSTVAAAPPTTTTSVPTNLVPYICWVCERQFASQKDLKLHEQQSKMHEAKMERQMFNNVAKREEIRVTILEAKSEMRELELETENQVIVPPDKQNRMMQLERTVRYCEREYGQRQEVIEANRGWSAVKEDEDDLDNPKLMDIDPMNPPPDSMLYPEFKELDSGRQYPHLRYSEKDLSIFPELDLSCGVSTWMGGKDAQEDRFCYDCVMEGPQKENLVGYAVFDGHSGHLCSEYAQKNLFPILQRKLKSNKFGRNNKSDSDDELDGELQLPDSTAGGAKNAKSASSSSSGGNKNKKDSSVDDKLTERYLRQCVEDTFEELDRKWCKQAKTTLDMDGTTATVGILWEDLWSTSSSSSGSSRGGGGGKNTSSDKVWEDSPDLRLPSDPSQCSNVRLMIANIGDTRAVMVQKKGPIQQKDGSYRTVKHAPIPGTSTAAGKEKDNAKNKKDRDKDGKQDPSPPERKIFVPCGPVSGYRLSDDHKPDRPDEKRRIEASGGVVQDMTGVARVFTPSPLQIGDRFVQWGLAVSRSFGDLPLKDPRSFGAPNEGARDLVSAKPEITCFHITPGRDLLLLLACDGVWDVVSDHDAATVCHGHYRAGLEMVLKPRADLLRLSPAGTLTHPVRHAAAQGARGVVRESFQRYSLDNLTALVVSLAPTQAWWDAVAGGGGEVRDLGDLQDGGGGLPGAKRSRQS